MTGLAAALAAVRERIEQACRRSGRESREVGLIAVSKTVSVACVREMIGCGHELFGENRVQEAQEKIAAIGEPARWHLIGQLQRNKARHAVGRFELIHGVDGEKLAAELDRRAAVAGIAQPVLVQVNLSNEPTKAGIDEAGLPGLLDLISGLDHLRLRGLMTIPPPVAVPEDSRRWFARLRELRDTESRRLGLLLPDLSMGMTGDFEVAIEEGATLIRVGRGLFGERT